MSCENNVCGTGGWNGPQPGDPDNNITLAARTVFGGVMVSWSYPLINPNAVAYTEVFRGSTAESASAVMLDRAGGGSYFDRVDPITDTEYYYWIEVVSIHGTRGARIGPAMGVARPQKNQTLEGLTGMIDAGLLAQTLKTDIAGITQNNEAIYKEIQDRLAANVALQDALAAVQGGLDEALTYVLQETTERTDADSALVTQINAIAAGLNENSAAIAEERTVRVTKTDALASDAIALTARVGTAEGDIVAERTARVNAVSAVVEDYNALYGRVGTAEGAITDIKSLNISPTSALATRLTNLATDAGDAKAAVQSLDTALTDGTHALAQRMTTAESAINGNVATGQVGLTTQVNTITGAMDAMYFAKLQVSGLIGGFGVWNNGAVVEAGFDVDTFWVGRTQANKVKPFVISSNGVVYIDKARIRDADIDTLKLAGEAVTVPIVSTVPDTQRRGRGEGTYDVVNVVYMNMAQPGMAYVLMTSAMGFAKNDRFWQFVLRVNGVNLRNIMGRQAESAPVMSAVIPLDAGVAKVEVLWSAHSDVIMGYNDLFMMGVKK